MTSSAVVNAPHVAQQKIAVADIPRFTEGILRLLAVVRGLTLSSTPPIVVLETRAFADACVEDVGANAGNEPWRDSELAATRIAARQHCDILYGFFDERHDRVIVDQAKFNAVPVGAQLGILVHELEHVIQTHALPTLPTAESPDQQLALLALREGDAELAARAFVRSLSGQTLRNELPALIKSIDGREPKSLRNEEVFKYALGARFVIELYLRGGFLAVNDAFARPPRSAAEILHFEKYLHQTLVPNLSSTVPLPSPFVGLASRPRGEYGLRDFLARCVPPGWEGDELMMSRRLGDVAIWRWVTAWQTERDATRFDEAIVRNGQCFGQPRLGLARQGKIVVLVYGLDEKMIREYASDVLHDVLHLPQ